MYVLSFASVSIPYFCHSGVTGLHVDLCLDGMVADQSQRQQTEYAPLHIASNITVVASGTKHHVQYYNRIIFDRSITWLTLPQLLQCILRRHHR
jgi:hypothetical protein